MAIGFRYFLAILFVCFKVYGQQGSLPPLPAIQNIPILPQTQPQQQSTAPQTQPQQQPIVPQIQPQQELIVPQIQPQQQLIEQKTLEEDKFQTKLIQKSEECTKEKSLTDQALDTTYTTYSTVGSYTEKPSDLEEKMNKIYKDILQEKKLKQFGYDFFRKTEKALSPVGDEYILGPGDIVKVYVWGDPVDILAVNREFNIKVSRDGTGYIQYIGQMSISGLKVGDLKKILQDRLSGKFKNLRVDLTLVKLRSFNVYTTGFVNKPGMVLVDSLDTIFDALLKSGGISKEGTLRSIELKRKEGKETKIYRVDLYDLFIKGNPIDIRLKDGDIIYVPPIGKTVAIFGDVKRPGIYELKAEKNISDVLTFAGGFNPSVSDVFARISRFSKDGVEIFEGTLEDKNFLSTDLKDGDAIFFGTKPEVFENSVVIKGEVYYPGTFSLRDTKNLKELIEKSKPKVNATYGILIRENKDQLGFDLKAVLDGIFNIELEKRDEVIIYSKFLDEPVYLSGEIKNPKTIPYYDKLTLLEALRDINFNHDIKHLKAVIMRKEEMKTRNKLGQDAVEEVNSVYLYDLLVKFDESKNVKLFPGDVIIIQKTYKTERSPSVTILGEVKNPGRYEINEGQTLYDVIKNAGGYTSRAYPEALIFIRESAKKLQKEKLDITLTTLEEEFIKSSRQVTFSSEEEKQATMMALQEQKNLLQVLKKKAEFGLGRIALELPDSLEKLKESNQNISVEDGDLIIVPPKPNYVLVIGDVYNQLSLPYIKGYKLRDYLEMVGGPGKNADRRNIYIIKANGRVVSSASSGRFFLIGSSIEDYVLKEGDTIVVPTEIKVPILWRPLIKDVIQIIFQSISTAVLAKRL